MTTKLSLYNGALRMLGERPLASLSENRTPRRELDAAWDGGAVDMCLEAGQWKFAMRSVTVDAETDIVPTFGYQYAFEIPDDHRRLGGVFSDEAMHTALMDYREEAGFWYANQETIYIRYVSNDPNFGLDLSRWPARFVKYVESHLAFEIAQSTTGDAGKVKDMISLRDKRFLPDALSNDAMQDPSRRLPPSNWSMARVGGYNGRENR
jgi:hypothetical protein